ncbi:MAG: hypothetical protein R3C59_16665 [Planctomycetaceae bacterium]
MRPIFLTLTALAAITAQTVNAQDFSNVRSGLLLGVYASPGNGGMRVSGLIPGYSAQGRLFPGDVLMRAAVDEYHVYSLRSQYEMENAKIAIGPNREAGVEIWRPGVGLIYAWVEFTPISGPTAAYTVSGSQPQKARAQFRMESEKPGARRLFQKSASDGNFSGRHPSLPTPVTPGHSSTRSASKLFGR